MNRTRKTSVTTQIKRKAKKVVAKLKQAVTSPKPRRAPATKAAATKKTPRKTSKSPGRGKAK